jgi:hypothetical protein
MHTCRRLYSAAYTMAAAVLGARAEKRDDDAPRMLSLPERSHRNRILAIRQRGIVSEVGREASHALVGAAVQLFDDIMLKYIGREQCTMSS